MTALAGAGPDDLAAHVVQELAARSAELPIPGAHRISLGACLEGQ